jgi:putative inorganic carbon (hco3(-)) transporter
MGDTPAGRTSGARPRLQGAIRLAPQRPPADTPATAEPAHFQADEAAEGNVVRRVGVLILGVFLFLFVSRIMDLTLHSLHLPLVLGSLALVAALLSGRLVDAFRTRVAVLLGALTLWIALGVPFAVWRGGPVALLIDQWPRVLLTCLLIVALAANVREIGYLMNAVGLGAVFGAVLGLRGGAISGEGRLAIMGSSRLDNPNDLAFVLLLGMPLCFRYMRSGGGGLFRKCTGGASLLAIAACFLKTGSRGGMIGFLAMVLVVFLRSSLSGKGKIVLAGVALYLMALVLLPGYVRQRYLTFESAEVDDGSTAAMMSMENATGSASARMTHLRDSINMTLRHPVFGVGAGNFVIAQAAEDRAAGQRPAWLGTHNAYTQIASECGIPGLILFLAVLVNSLRSVRLAWKLSREATGPAAAEIRLAASVLEAALWGMSVFLVFAHLGYEMTVYLFIGLSAALAQVARRGFGADPAATHPAMQ